jgi:hypothetical protein
MRWTYLHPVRMGFLIFSLVGLFSTSAWAQEKLPPGVSITAIEAIPSVIDLKSPFEYRQLLISAKLATGESIDVTRMAQLTAPSNLIKLSPTGQVRPLADGEGQLKISMDGKEAVVALKVTGFKAGYQASFLKDVQPMLGKTGCNQGTCHGSADGKNGFKLSLRGYDPIYDHRALTDDLEGRRINRAAPDRSLMLLKTSGGVAHTGGAIWTTEDPGYQITKNWIQNGVKLDLNAARVASIEVLPKDPGIPIIGLKQQFAVVATYTDGMKRDVTAEAFIETSNGDVATMDKAGLATTARRGEATILARYEGAYAASTMVVMGDRKGFEWNNPPAFNHLDELVYEKLKRVKVLPSELCKDDEFIRRIYLDLTGLPPTADDVKKFLTDSRPSQVKRNELIDKLVLSPAYVQHWTNKWADMLQVNRKFLGDLGAKSLRDYIQASISANKPYNQFAYEVLTGTGSNAVVPTAAYYKTLRTPDLVMENTTHLFLAIRFNCNKCHDHPFEKWTQDQYYNLTAYFAQVNRKEDPKYKGQKIGGSAVEGAVPLVEIIEDINSGEVKHERTGEVAKPKFPFEHADLPKGDAPRRTQLAKWITSKENPYFAKSYVNRIWSYLTGVGIIEPVDDIRAGNPATNPALLDRLTKDFIASNFNTAELIKSICKTRTYQLSITTNVWNKDDDINYARAIARRLPAEALYDAIHAVTGAQTSLPGLPAGARAAQVLDGSVDLPSGFLDLFGKPVRESACECERSSGLMLGPVLNLVNGPIVGDAIREPSNRINKLALQIKDDREYVKELYLWILNRYPTDKEIELGLNAFKAAEGEYTTIVGEFEKRRKALLDYEKQVDARLPEFVKSVSKAPTWTTLELADLKSEGKAEFEKLTDGSILVKGPNPEKDTYTFTAKTDLKGITGLRLEVLADDRLPAKGPGRAQNGNLVLHELTVQAAPGDKPMEKKPVKFSRPQASFSQGGFAIAGAVDNNPGTGWALSDQLGRNHEAAFDIKPVINNAKVGTVLSFSISQQYGQQHTIGRFRISVTTDRQPSLKDNVNPELRSLVSIEPSKRTPDQTNRLLQMQREQDATYKQLRDAIAIAPPVEKRVLGAQDLVWALINSPAFLFNH